jgi:hypothetical protein
MNGDFRARFAVFEVDLATGELFNNGTRLPVQEKPFQILALLLQRPGQLVTRQESTGVPTELHRDGARLLHGALLPLLLFTERGANWSRQCAQPALLSSMLLVALSCCAFSPAVWP